MIISIVGPMYAAKSSLMMIEANNYAYNYIDKKMNKIVYIKIDFDKRYLKEGEKNNYITTHSGIKKDAITITKADDILNYDADIYCIDEGHFLDLADVCDQLSKKGKVIIVSMLIGDKDKKPFPNSSKIMALSDKIIFKSGRCKRCLLEKGIWVDAPFTYCKSKFDGQILVGGDEIYESLCGDCYNKLTGSI